MDTLPHYLLSHLAVVTTWLAVAAACVGVGLLYRALFAGQESLGTEDMFLSFWVGFALVLLLLHVWHFVQPISGALTIVVAVTGASGLILARRAIASTLRSTPWRSHWLPLALAGALVFWTANRALGPVVHYDSGMYHIPTVEWANAHAIVPGLGNLHGRLAFNASSLLFAALVDVGPWDGRSYHIANGVLVVMLLLQGVAAWGRLVTRVGNASNAASAPARVADVFDAVVLAAVAPVLMRDDVSSLDTDLPVFLVLLVVATRIFRSLRVPEISMSRARWHFGGTVLLIAAGVALKLSSAVVGMALLVTALWGWRAVLIDSARGIALGTLVRVFALPTALVVTWMARGLFLSGYPVYPLTLFGVPVPWRLPVEQAQLESDWVTMSARHLNHNRVSVGFDWLGPWVRELLTTPEYFLMVPVPLVLAAIIGVLLWRRWKQSRGMPDRATASAAFQGWPLVAVVAVAAPFWFLMAPHPRFGAALTWILFATVAALYAGLNPRGAAANAHRVAIGTAAAAAAFLAVQAVFHPIDLADPRKNLPLAFGDLIVRPGPDRGMHPPATPVTLPYTAPSGLVLQVPPDNNLCWRGPLLCTPHPSVDLRPRNKESLAAGFLADPTTWRPLRWPNPWTPFMTMWRCQRGKLPQGRLSDRECLTLASQTPVDTLVGILRGTGRARTPRASLTPAAAVPQSR